MEAIPYEPTLRLMLIAEWRHQNREVCLCLNVCCCWHEFQSFCENSHLWVHNHIDVYCLLAPSKNKEIFVFLAAYFFCLLKWCGQELSKFLCKKLSRNLQSRWCLLSDDLTRTKIFLFVLILIHFCCLINPW